ncbi:MAG: bifunctional folylpolyglutamate synthase/dihydrofolate synthase [Candidatus Mcinerneyibacterium aminivorans]|uniref:tetrahydrofolate synthase n=1 Tax=Candidatus Mcinerneyibacterium aminivorans TaxID=2703815 RepID=A0A5D0MGG9_9BACT|nr:MAG: bifunctional folylpolyglutamate synthase/dihydrofolate synthase [Candidatus Mcinerneyibacterium aminivorans]
MTYQEAIDYLNSFINYEKKRTKKYNSELYNLEEFRNIAEKFDNPQNDIKTIHVAGSKGKGSTVEYISNILIENGFKVGTFTSPHLYDVKERIRINKEQINKSDFAKITRKISETIDRENIKKRYRTFFELITLMSFLYFKKNNVDYAVYEVGLGGRLDTTNIIKPEVSVITLIDLEHTNLLGNTLKKIAYEKAGIIKENIPVVISKQKRKDVANYFTKISQRRKALLFLYGRDFKVVKDRFILENGKQIGPIKLKMEGAHQLVNAVTALQATRVLNVDMDVNRSISALINTKIKGRIDIRRIRKRIVILDTGHTPESIKVLFEVLQKKYEKFTSRNVFSIISFSSGKKIKKMLEYESRFNTRMIFTENSSFRSATIKEMEKFISPFKSFKKLEKAFSFAMEKSRENDIILIHGSFYLMNDVNKVLGEYGEKL